MDHLENDYDNNNTMARLIKPKIIVFTFHGTLAPSDWEEKCISPYVKENLKNFLIEKWSTSSEVWELINRLKNQSFDQHFVFETAKTPLIVGFDTICSNWKQVIDTVCEYVFWEMNKFKMSIDTLLLIKLCWIDGFQKKALKSIIFDDVKSTLDKWKSMNIRLAIYSTMESTILKTILASTNQGDLSKKFDFYIDPTTIGEPPTTGFYDRLAKHLNCNKKDILLICNYGQHIRMACENELQGLILIRPGNRKTRSYYLMRFPSTDSLKNIEFV